MKTWADYWAKFNVLITSVEATGSRQIAIDLKEAQKYVNGMTDGWHEFKGAMDSILLTKQQELTADQIEVLNDLIEALNLEPKI